MTVNKLLVCLCCFTILFGCQADRPDVGPDGLEILNLTIQAIHSEINVTSCYRKEVNQDCQCQEAFSYIGDSIIIVKRFFEFNRSNDDKRQWVAVDSTMWEKIKYYKKINLSSLENIKLERKHYNTKFFLIHDPWYSQDTVFVHVSMHGPREFSGHRITFVRDRNNNYKMNDLELMGFN